MAPHFLVKPHSILGLAFKTLRDLAPIYFSRLILTARSLTSMPLHSLPIVFAASLLSPPQVQTQLTGSLQIKRFSILPDTSPLFLL